MVPSAMASFPLIVRICIHDVGVASPAEPLLRAEVVDDQRGGDPGVLCEGPEGGRLEALDGKAGQGGIPDAGGRRQVVGD
jgi:hypothetical protein